MKSIFTSIIPALLLASSTLAAQNRYFVNQAATGANTGISWTDAFTDLQAALALAQSGDEVWVAEGTYRPTNGTDRKISFEPKNRVRLYGGFAGVETDLTQRDWQAHSTVLSGDIGAPGDSTDNSYNVVFLLRPDEGTVLDGLVIRHGNADDTQAALGSRDRAICGGGLYIMAEDAEAYPDIRNCRFEHNTAYQSGGAVMVNAGGDGSALPVLENCILADNRSVRNGGGMARFGGSWVDRGAFLRDCRFERNSAGQRGGGLYYTGSTGTDSMMLHGCVFEENSAWIAGGGAFFFLGRPGDNFFQVSGTEFIKNISIEGIAIDLFSNGEEFNGYIFFDKCQFNLNNNYNNANFASIFYYALLGNSGKTKITKSEFNNNSIQNLLLLIEHNIDSIFLLNSSFFNNARIGIEEGRLINITSPGRAVLIDIAKFVGNNNSSVLLFFPIGSNLYVNNSLFVSNQMREALDFGVFRNDYSPMQLVVSNSTFVNNNGSPISSFLKKSVGPSISTLQCSNIIFQDTAHVNHFPLGWNTPTLLTHSSFDALNCAALPPSVICGPGLLIGGDPMFVNPDSGDYRLQPCSPLLNAGSNAYVFTPTDLAGNPRVQGGTVDIGAYEHQGPFLAADPDVLPSCPGGTSGAIAPHVQDACPPLSVAWQSGAASGTALTGLSPGTYQITLTDAAGQSVAFEATVTTGDAPDLLPLPTPVACGDTLGGSAAAAVAGVPGPFAFDWGPLGADSLITNLSPGLYPVTVTDTRGCTATGNVQVERSGNLSVTVDALGISCHGSADGSLTVLPTDGKPPFAWNWSNPPGAAGATVAMLGPGTYEGTLTDAFGCSIGWVLPLGQPDPLLPGAFVTDASDSSSADGSILLMPTGGTGPYTAMWSNGGVGLLHDDLSPGAYFATITDANGCTIATPVILVGVTTSTGEPDTAADWQVWPNPASDVAWVALDGAAPQKLSIRLWSSDGRVVLGGTLPAGADRLALRVAGLASGTYFLEVAGRVRKVDVTP